MGKGDYGDGVPDEVRNFKVPPDTKMDTEPTSALSKREGFLYSVKSSLEKRVKNGFLSQEEADGKFKRAELIDEVTLPEDLTQAAELFASAGNANERQTSSVLNTVETASSKREDFLSYLEDFLEERVHKNLLTQKDADEKLERAELIDEATLPEDLRQAAELFAASGNANEQEIAGISKFSTRENGFR